MRQLLPFSFLCWSLPLLLMLEIFLEASMSASAENCKPYLRTRHPSTNSWFPFSSIHIVANYTKCTLIGCIVPIFFFKKLNNKGDLVFSSRVLGGWISRQFRDLCSIGRKRAFPKMAEGSPISSLLETAVSCELQVTLVQVTGTGVGLYPQQQESQQTKFLGYPHSMSNF